MSEDTDITTEVAPPSEAERRMVQTLLLLSDDARRDVMAKLDPAARERAEQLIIAAQGDMAMTTDVKRQLVRETAEQLYKRRIAAADELAVSADLHVAPATGIAAATGNVHPLDQLRSVHPAALARAMQGERAEAWALVLDRLEPNAQSALRMYLDEDARVAIEQARTHQMSLATPVRNTIERAIARTIVPQALREHARLLTSDGAGGPAAAFA
jgi:hypothetical protein